jgi:hypothetical protein
MDQLGPARSDYKKSRSRAISEITLAVRTALTSGCLDIAEIEKLGALPEYGDDYDMD